MINPITHVVATYLSTSAAACSIEVLNGVLSAFPLYGIFPPHLFLPLSYDMLMVFGILTLQHTTTDLAAHYYS